MIGILGIVKLEIRFFCFEVFVVLFNCLINTIYYTTEYLTYLLSYLPVAVVEPIDPGLNHLVGSNCGRLCEYTMSLVTSTVPNNSVSNSN